MRVMAPDVLLAPRAWLRLFLCLANLFGATRGWSQPISITFGSGGFTSGPSVKQVRTLVRQVLEDRVARFSRCDVRLDGTSTSCDMYVSLQLVRIKVGDHPLVIRAIHGRIPIGNFVVLVQGRLRWPDSFQVKDLTVELQENDLAAWFSTTQCIRSAQAVPPGGTCRMAVSLPAAAAARRRLVKRLFDIGLAVDGAGAHTVIRDSTSIGRLFIRGTVPVHLGDRPVEAIGTPVGTPAGRLAFDCSLAVVGGTAFIKSPENYLAADAYSRAFAQLQQEVDNVFVCQSFVEGAYLTATGGIVIEGLAVVSGMDHIDRLQSSSRRARVNGQPTLDVNPYR